MNILSIETSCDETALSIITSDTIDSHEPNFEVLSDLVISQIETHIPYGGVFPALAKREHALNLVPLLNQVLKEAGLHLPRDSHTLDESLSLKIEEILSREPELEKRLSEFLSHTQTPDIDMIMVTYGPGLAPALWVGVNFARALSLAWNIPIVPVNHMEGHISSILMRDNYSTESNALHPLSDFQFPMIALLISGGHTQLVLVNDWGDYKVIGETIDDAVGEAFDKVARMLGMDYPGGPHVSKAAKNGKPNHLVTLPRPMLNSKSYEFSFSGLKTAVRYLVEKLKNDGNFNARVINDIAREFEHAVTEVLIKKTCDALEEYDAKGLIIAGGVAANDFIVSSFRSMLEEKFSIPLYLPHKKLCGDNSLMIASAGFLNYWKNKKAVIIPQEEISAVGNLKL